MKPVKSPPCSTCKHFRHFEYEGLTCDAFPYGIPDEIIFSENLHKKPLEGQGNDIIYEKVDPIRS